VPFILEHFTNNLPREIQTHPSISSPAYLRNAWTASSTIPLLPEVASGLLVDQFAMPVQIQGVPPNRNHLRCINNPDSFENPMLFSHLITPYSVLPLIVDIRAIVLDHANPPSLTVQNIMVTIINFLITNAPIFWVRPCIASYDPNHYMGPVVQHPTETAIQSFPPCLFHLIRAILFVIINMYGRYDFGPSTQDLHILAMYATAYVRFVSLGVGLEVQDDVYLGYPGANGIWYVPDPRFPDRYYHI
jgi:hypothetical protein